MQKKFLLLSYKHYTVNVNPIDPEQKVKSLAVMLPLICSSQCFRLTCWSGLFQVIVVAVVFFWVEVYLDCRIVEW